MAYSKFYDGINAQGCLHSFAIPILKSGINSVRLNPFEGDMTHSNEALKQVKRGNYQPKKLLLKQLPARRFEFSKKENFEKNEKKNMKFQRN